MFTAVRECLHKGVPDSLCSDVRCAACREPQLARASCSRWRGCIERAWTMGIASRTQPVGANRGIGMNIYHTHRLPSHGR